LHNNDLVIDYGSGTSPLTALRGWMKSGLTSLGGAGTTGIGSSEADNGTRPGAALGIMDNLGLRSSMSGFALAHPMTWAI